MNEEITENYRKINESGGFYQLKRGLIKVWGKEAIQFLNGLITNDIAKLEESSQISAAFPNAQGRTLAVVRVLKKDGAFWFETEETTREKVFNNLFRFTFAGDFYVEDLSEKYKYFSTESGKWKTENEEFVGFARQFGTDIFVPNAAAEEFITELKAQNAVEISGELYETRRIEHGIPLYGVDIDETTIVPEIGDDAISYTKGCYIGQEIIARIHFRGHVAKQLRGLIFDGEHAAVNPNDEIKTPDGKNAGKITSFTFSPKFGKFIALGFVRYDYLADGTRLKIGDLNAQVKRLPFD